MRILLYSSQFPTLKDPNGGVFTAQLAHAMARTNDVEVVCPLPWCPNTGWARRHPVWSQLAGVPACGEYRGLPVFYPKYLHVPKLSGPWQPLLQALSGRALCAGRHAQRPFDVIHAHWLYPDGVAAALLAQRLRLPLVLTALGSDVNVAARYRLRRIQIQWALRRAATVTAVSRALVARLIEIGAPAARVHYIPNGIDAHKFSPPDSDATARARTALGLDSEARYLLFVGRLHAVKGLHTLLQALARLKAKGPLEFTTLLVGDGAERRGLEAQASALGLRDVVRFIGERPHDEISIWLRAADCFCLPSLMEGMPNVVLEASACGLPVVATNVGALPDMINPKTGVLVPPSDPNALADAIARAFGTPWRRTDVAHASLTQSWDAIAERYNTVLAPGAAAAALQVT